MSMLLEEQYAQEREIAKELDQSINSLQTSLSSLVTKRNQLQRESEYSIILDKELAPLKEEYRLLREKRQQLKQEIEEIEQAEPKTEDERDDLQLNLHATQCDTQIIRIEMERKAQKIRDSLISLP